MMMYHQLKGGEITALLAYLEGLTRWGGALAAANVSAGHLIVVEKAGEGRLATFFRQRPVPPFIIV